jgi:hypothetical protein
MVMMGTTAEWLQQQHMNENGDCVDEIMLALCEEEDVQG